MRGQFQSRQNWLTCDECQGRSFNDPTKEFHWTDCSRYKEWRYGRTNPPKPAIEPYISPHGVMCPCWDCTEGIKRRLRAEGVLPRGKGEGDEL